MTLSTTFRRFLKRNNGATAIEYGLIAGLIALVIFPAIQLIGTKLNGTFGIIATSGLNACGDDPSGDCIPPTDPTQ